MIMTTNKSKTKKRNNVTKIHYIPSISIGVVILVVVVFIFIFGKMMKYLTKERVLSYEVCAGALVSDNRYTGIVIYDEALKKSDYSGYINYFIQDSERAGTESVICSIDETGELSSKLTINPKDTILNPNTLDNITRSITKYSKEKKNNEFYEAYNLLNNINSTISEYNSGYLIDSLNTLLEDENNFINVIKPEKSLIISLYYDSLFNINEYQINKESFNKENYEITNLRNRNLVGKDDILYRSIDSDEWKIVFPIEENDVSKFSTQKNIVVRFVEYGITANAEFYMINNIDGTYGVIKLSRYLANFINSRFIDFEISHSASSGLKIPISSVCEKEFFTIPTEYGVTTATKEGNITGFILIGYDQNGKQTEKFVPATYYNNENGFYYVSKELFNIGDCVLLNPDTESQSYANDIYIIGTVESLKGVYCINRGYCQFKKVNIIDRNDEYYIVEKGTQYGLSIYDHIILNSDLVTENQIIY